MKIQEGGSGIILQSLRQPGSGWAVKLWPKIQEHIDLKKEEEKRMEEEKSFRALDL